MDAAIDVLSALLTPVIGIVATWIAYQQYKTNQRAARREARSGQIAVYKEVKLLLNFIDSNGEVSETLYDQFLSAVAEADFLFGEDIRDWLGEVQSEVGQLLAWEQAVFDLKREHRVMIKPDEALEAKAPEDYQYLKGEIEKNIDALQNYHIELRDKFSPYLGKHESPE